MGLVVASLAGNTRSTASRPAQMGAAATGDMRGAHDTCFDALFWLDFAVVLDKTSSVDALRSWGSGCTCHEDQRRGGETIRCGRAGRRVHDALQNWRWDKVRLFVNGLA